MSARETIDQARGLGTILGESEARVALHPQSISGARIWLGTDFNERPVAYFEVHHKQVSSCAVSQVIDVEPVESVVGSPPEDVRALKVVCREPRLTDVFIAFMDDVIAQREDGDIADVLANLAASWRNLLRIAQQGLSDASAIGLYGELRLLEDLIDNRGAASLETWQRDGQDVHDFISKNVRVEVKTSTFRNRHSVTIHGLRQLEVPSGQLFLAVAEVEAHGSGETMDDVVDRLLDKGADVAVLTEKLAMLDFVRGMGSMNEEHRFALRSWRFWEISNRSPVLSPQVIPLEVKAAVSDLRYSLNLSALGQPDDSFDWSKFPDSGHK